MIKNKKIVSTLAIMLILSTVVIASSRIANIKVVYDNIKIVVDGKEVHFGSDSEGKKIEPFIYNGTTYLPVRAVGEAVGKEVSWDQSSKTVFLGGQPNNTAVENSKENYLIDELRFISEDGVNPYDSEESNKGLEFFLGNRKIANVSYNLEGKYKRITALPTVYYSTSNTISVKFIGDGSLLKEYIIQKDEMGESIDVDVTGIKHLMIQVERDEDSNGRLRLVALKIK